MYACLYVCMYVCMYVCIDTDAYIGKAISIRQVISSPLENMHSEIGNMLVNTVFMK